MAIDGAGNRASATSSFIASAPRVVPKVGVSQATANVANSSLTLHFTGALDAVIAGDAAHHGVSVNGYEVTAASAAYNATTHSVTLDLGAGALHGGTLHGGTAVTVAWHDLQAVSGQAVTDGTVRAP